MRKEKIKAYLFDLGNVIVDVRLDRFLYKLGTEESFTVEEIERMFKKSGDKEQYEIGTITTDEFIKRSVNLLNICCERRRFVDAWNSIIGNESKDVGRIIKLCARNYPVYLLSNTNPLHFEQACRLAPSLGLFKGYFLSYELKLLKPDPAIYIEVMKRIGFSPDQVFFVDDEENNVSSAKEMGIYAVRFEGAQKLEEIIRALE